MATGTYRDMRLDTVYEDDDDDGVDRMNEYLDDPTSFRIRIPQDVQLYKSAINCDLGELVFKFVNVLRTYPLEVQFDFINRIPLANAEIRVTGRTTANPMLEYIFEILTWSSLEVLSKISINMLASAQHEYLYDFLEIVKDIRQDMYPIDKSYDAPHVVLSLSEKDDDEEMYCVKYFNGTRWCKLQVDGCINSIIQHLDPHNFVIVGEYLWFLKEGNYLGKINLFRDEDMKYHLLPIPLPNDAQLCTNGEDIVIFSNKKQMAEVVPTKYSNQSHRVSEVKKVMSYETVASEEYFDLYRVQSLELNKTIHVCFTKTDTSMFELDGDTLCEYVVIPHYLYRQTSSDPKHKHFIIPQDTKETDWTLGLVKTSVIQDYISNFISHSSISKNQKQKHGSFFSRIKKRKHKANDEDSSSASVFSRPAKIKHTSGPSCDAICNLSEFKL